MRVKNAVVVLNTYNPQNIPRNVLNTCADGVLPHIVQILSVFASSSVNDLIQIHLRLMGASTKEGTTAQLLPFSYMEINIYVIHTAYIYV
jgi:hypothetical protein